jgi:hypothetical protein
MNHRLAEQQALMLSGRLQVEKPEKIIEKIDNRKTLEFVAQNPRT